MIEAVYVTKFYNRINALINVSLRIAKGDIYGIIGLSGAGKSTLIRSLSGLIAPDSGKILFHGTDIATLQGQAKRGFHLKTGMIFQHFNLLSSRTVGGNVAYPLEIANAYTKERVEELLQFVGLSSKIDTYPSNLSGGEKQRVGIARAIANHPEILFCDEATSSLDPKTTQEILQLLKKLNQNLGVTIVLITHDMDVIKAVCNKVAVIEEGKIVEEGPIAQIFSEPEHPTTKHFIQSSIHEIPRDLIRPPSPNLKLLRLRFKGKSAAEPVISQLTQKFHVEANILLGWIDNVQDALIGTLVIELSGPEEGIEKSLHFLTEHSVHWEEVTNAS